MLKTDPKTTKSGKGMYRRSVGKLHHNSLEDEPTKNSQGDLDRDGDDLGNVNKQSKWRILVKKSKKKVKKGKKQRDKASAKFIEDVDEVILEVTGNQAEEFCNESELEGSQSEEEGEVNEVIQSEAGSENDEVVTLPHKEGGEMNDRESRNNNAVIDPVGTTKHRRTYYEESDVGIMPKTAEQLQKEREDEEAGMQRFINYM